MSQKTNKTNKAKVNSNAISNMDDCNTNCTNSLVDSTASGAAYSNVKKQINKKKNGPTDCR